MGSISNTAHDTDIRGSLVSLTAQKRCLFYSFGFPVRCNHRNLDKIFVLFFFSLVQLLFVYTCLCCMNGCEDRGWKLGVEASKMYILNHQDDCKNVFVLYSVCLK